MIIQAISLLDELDKEINIYAMRVKEWYGWHFPELQKIVLDNISAAELLDAYRISVRAIERISSGDDLKSREKNLLNF